MRQRSCVCGAVIFQVAGAVQALDACHCPDCCKQSGHFFTSTGVPLGALTIRGEELVTWYASSEKVKLGFCATCGSTLFWNPFENDWAAIAMVSFDTPTDTNLGKHIFGADKVDHYEIVDGLLQNQQ